MSLLCEFEGTLSVLLKIEADSQEGGERRLYDTLMGDGDDTIEMAVLDAKHLHFVRRLDDGSDCLGDGIGEGDEEHASVRG